jgi:hypothetical protein
MERNEQQTAVRRYSSAIGKRWLYMAIVMIGLMGGVSGTASGQFSYDLYADVLTTYVDDTGMVDYAGLKANRDKLDRFGQAMASLDRKEFDSWTDDQKIAFWINAYNALTLQVIIDHYPIEPSWLGSLRFPDNSIRQISGVWDEITFPVMGKEMTLDQIEHDTLRADFDEARIHMALVCAAMGCPPLRNEAYTGPNLDGQLDDQSRRFLRNPKKFRIDQPNAVVYLSSIFSWFGEDFIPEYGIAEPFGDFSRTEAAVLHFVSLYVPKKEKEYVKAGNYSVDYLDYDWSLNEQK